MKKVVTVKMDRLEMDRILVDEAKKVAGQGPGSAVVEYILVSPTCQKENSGNSSTVTGVRVDFTCSLDPAKQ